MHRNTCVFVLTIAILLTVGLVLASPVLAAAPSPPSNLNVQPQGLPSSNIIVAWQAPPEPVDYYNIYKSFNGPITSISSQNLADFVSGGTTTYTDTDTIPGETFFYQVTAVNGSGEESLLATPILSDNATVPGKLFPHKGEFFTTTGGFCRFCHRVHKAQGSKKVLRKKLIEEVEVCYTCHDGTGSDFNIMSQFNIPTSAHNNVLQGNISANIKCLNCHHPHGKPPNPRMTHELEENLCFQCHRVDGESFEGVKYSTAPDIKGTVEPFTGWIAGAPSGKAVVKISTNKGQGWTGQYVNTGNTLKSLHFVDGKNGWVAGSGGAIYNTTDSGTTWNSQESSTSNALNSIFFVDEAKGWAVGINGSVVKTTDGGSTPWSSQTVGTTSYNSVFFINSSTGWITGNSGVIRKSTNGGSSWAVQNSTITQNINNIYFIDQQLGWAVGDGGKVVKTVNGGTNWVVKTSGTSQVLNNVIFANNDRGWAVGDGGVLINTKNGGETWTLKSSGTNVDLHGISFVNRLRGWVAGVNGIIKTTNNGGDTWTSQSSGTNVTLYDIQFPDNNNLITGEIYSHPVENYTSRHTTSYDENDDYRDGSGTNKDGKFGDGYRYMTASTRHIECTDCHNQHQASRIGSTILGPLEGTAGVLVANGTSVGVPAYTFSSNVTSQYQVCFKCHSSFNPSFNSTPFWAPYYRLPDNKFSSTPVGHSPASRGDKAIEFNTNNSAFHPVEGPGRNRSKDLCEQLQNRFSLSCSNPILALGSLTIKCTDCHNNNISDGARGPHGSGYKSILKANFWNSVDGPVTYNSDNFALCFTCHDKTKIVEAQSIKEGSRTNFAKDDQSLHYKHLIKHVSKGIGCKNCHNNVHSNQQASNTLYVIENGPYAGSYTMPPKEVPTRMVNFGPEIKPNDFSKPKWGYNPATRERTCSVVCHGATMNQTYTPNVEGDLP